MDYITCNWKKSRPRVSTSVCEKCRRKKSCFDYGNYLQPSFFPDIIRVRVKRPIYRIVDKPRLIDSRVDDVSAKGEQLVLNLSG